MPAVAACNIMIAFLKIFSINALLNGNPVTKPRMQIPLNIMIFTVAGC
jgi:hypothetical protein